MITKQEIISVLISYGLSNIEADSVLDSEKSFGLAIEDLLDKAVTDAWKPTKKLYTAQEYNKLHATVNLLKSHIKKLNNRMVYKDRKARNINRHLKQMRDRISYLMKHNFTRTFKYK